jgi:3-dehydroquinate dehydratase I
MRIQYCLPIIKNSKKEVVRMMESNKKDYQYFEVWLDYIQDIDESFVKKVADHWRDKVVFLFHRGAFNGVELTKEKKLSLISVLDNTGAVLDLDISEIDKLVYLQEKKLTIKKIISYHDYNKTPDEETLGKIISQMDIYQPTIYKIATKCKNANEALRLLELLVSLKSNNKKAIILGMGEFGTITRVYGTLWGNELIYAPKEHNDASAPGQFTKNELDKIFSILNSIH